VRAQGVPTGISLGVTTTSAPICISTTLQRTATSDTIVAEHYHTIKRQKAPCVVMRVATLLCRSDATPLLEST